GIGPQPLDRPLLDGFRCELDGHAAPDDRTGSGLRCWTLGWIRLDPGSRWSPPTQTQNINAQSKAYAVSNRVYIGEAVHRGKAYPGEHQPIIPKDLWDKVHSILADSPRKRAGQSRRQTTALLKGLIFAPNGQAMSPTHTPKGGKLYRYYVTQSVLKLGPDTCPIRRIPAGEIETAVIDQLRAILASPEIIVRTLREAWQAELETVAANTDGMEADTHTEQADSKVCNQPDSPKQRFARPCSGWIRSGTNSSRQSRRGSSNCWWSGWMSASKTPASG
ncbi:hypothetical protein KEU06_28900, partial [Pseudaminobacter sp. 19-2017]|nr:hypothetical protein [Pseudaminobacter soli]